eukprot:GHUV01000376.1.p1 GENE.GHUV01000376.1~~GHUV01000376.1.p1  ORF type:complete len:327 (+),score=88.28 GHUV01000376.1:226-1206(+)
MSLAIPPFNDMAKAARTVLYGDVATGEGQFTPGMSKVSANTVTADGVIFNLSATVNPAGVVVPSVTTMYNASKNLMLMAILGPAGSVTGAATFSNIMNVPGLQATLTSSPPLGGQSPSNTLTLDYITQQARFRTIISPDNLNPVDPPPKVDFSATTSAGPCVLGARVGVDTAKGVMTQWAVGANWTRMTAGNSEVAGLAGQQLGVVITDTAPNAAGSSIAGGPGRSATVTFNQIMEGGKLSLAAEYAHALTQAGSKHDNGYALTLGAARRLDTGGLVKCRVGHTGAVAVLYEQVVPGMGRLGLSAQMDATQPSKVSPSLGFALNVV